MSVKILFLSLLGGIWSEGLCAQQWSALGDSLDGTVYYLYDDTVSGQLIATGGFDNIGSMQVDGIAAWDGETWNTLATGINTGFNPVGAVCRFQGDIYSEGLVSELNIGNESVLKLTNGVWEEVGQTYGVTARLRAIGDKLYALGTFDSIAGIAAYGIASYNGSQWESVGNDLNAVYLNDVAEFQGELYVVGKFDDGSGIANIAKLVDGQWQSVGGGINTWDGYGGELLVFQDMLYVSGYFQQWEGNIASNIMAWDGSEWFSPQGGVTRANGQGFIRRMTTDGEYLYVVGGFDTAGILPTSEMARWDGQNWCGFNVWTNNGANFLMHYQGQLVIAGGFYWVNDSPIPQIAVSPYYVESCTTVGIEETAGAASRISIHPNPTTSTTTLTWQTQTQNTYQLHLYDVHGRQVQHHSGKQTTGKNTLAIDLSNLAKGIYFGRLVVGKEIHTFKVVRE